MALLKVQNLEVAFGSTRILRGVSLEVNSGETLGIVGESGCGKSMTAFAIMGMVPHPGRVVGGQILFEGRDLNKLTPREWLDIRGQEIALIMQDPFTSLNPMMRIGDQIAEVLILHKQTPSSLAKAQAIEMLAKVGVPAPKSSARKYPHQLSGGQRQRVVIAMAFACRPKLLIADEPTTALDVTLQAQILRLIKQLQEEENTAVILISHDLGVIGALSSRIAVFYSGKVVELGDAKDVLSKPVHPYTIALLNALPRAGVKKLESIGGQPPDPSKLGPGCAFAPRCAYAFEKCKLEPGLLLAENENHHAACWLVEKEAISPEPSLS